MQKVILCAFLSTLMSASTVWGEAHEEKGKDKEEHAVKEERAAKKHDEEEMVKKVSVDVHRGTHTVAMLMNEARKIVKSESSPVIHAFWLPEEKTVVVPHFVQGGFKEKEK